MSNLLKSLPKDIAVLSHSDFVLDAKKKALCEGGYGSIFKATTKRRFGQNHASNTVAIKFFGYVLDKDKYTGANEPKDDDILNEIKLMNKLRGLKGVIDLYGVYEDSAKGILPNKNPRFLQPHLAIVMELIKGGDLFNRISTMIETDNDGRKIVNLTERYLSDIVRSFIKGMIEIHERNYIHCDIKMENIMLLRDDQNCSDTKIVDFGIMLPINETTKKTTLISGVQGTEGFFAPESLLHREYSVKSDVWQCGCVLYTMLCGSYLPDNFVARLDKDNNALVEKFYKEYETSPEDYDYFLFPEHDWSKVSSVGRDLVRRMLEPDVKKRIAMEDILRHPWLTGKAPTTKLTHEYGTRIKRLALRKRLKKVFESRMEIIDLTDDSEAVKAARKMFDEIDHDSNGSITKIELIEGVRRLVSTGSFDDKTINDTNDAFEAIDLNKDGHIDFEEFLEFHKIVVSSTTTCNSSSSQGYPLELKRSWVWNLPKPARILIGCVFYLVFLGLNLLIIPSVLYIFYNFDAFRQEEVSSSSSSSELLSTLETSASSNNSNNNSSNSNISSSIISSIYQMVPYYIPIALISWGITITNWAPITKIIAPCFVDIFNVKTNMSPLVYGQYLDKSDIMVIHSQNLRFFAGSIFEAIVLGKSPCEVAHHALLRNVFRFAVDDSILFDQIKEAIINGATIVPCIVFNKSPFRLFTIPFISELTYCFGDPIPTSGLMKPSIKRLPSSSAIPQTPSNSSSVNFNNNNNNNNSGSKNSSINSSGGLTSRVSTSRSPARRPSTPSTPTTTASNNNISTSSNRSNNILAGDGDPSIKISDEVVVQVLRRFKVAKNKVFHNNKFRINLHTNASDSQALNA